MVLLTLLFLTSLFYYLPETVLASIIMIATMNLFDFKQIKFIFETSKIDFLVFLLTFLGTLSFGIEIGILIGIGFSIIILILQISKPNIVILGASNQSIQNHFSYCVDIEQHIDNKIFEGIEIIRSNLNNFNYEYHFI